MALFRCVRCLPHPLTERHVQEGQNPRQHRCEKLKNCINFFVSCVIGKPRPVVTWYRNEQVASNVSTVLKTSVGGHFVRNEITVRNLGRQDLHSQLKCHASNNNRTHPLEATVHVDMNCKYTQSVVVIVLMATREKQQQKVLSCENFSYFSSFLK